MTIDDSQTM